LSYLYTARGMDRVLPFFNWSLKKALATEPDGFIRARVRIIYTVLLLGLLKIGIVLWIGSANEQWLQVARAAVALIISVCLLKLLLYRPSRTRLLSHIMIQLGIAVIWSSIFLYTHKINLLSLQFVFMIVLSGFYTLGSVAGIVYAILGTLPVMALLIFKGNVDAYLPNAQQEFASPGFEILAALNFLTIIIAHYLFFKAYHASLREKEQLNRQLQLSIDKANKLAASRYDFLSTMSHELRTPLNSVVGIAELLLQDNPEERQKDNLKVLQFSALDLLSLINNVLDFNKVDSDKVVLEAVPFRLAEFMQNICMGLRIKANDKKLDFILDIDAALAEMNIVSDPTRLSQLIYNLAGNAIKFTDKGSVTIQLACVGRTEQEVTVLFSVTDTGIGIPAEKHDTIFELFSQAETHTTRKYGGTGLGLAIVKQVLTLFNSSIQLKSSSGHGAAFSFTISFAIAKETQAAKAPIASDMTDISHMSILIAEDNEINRIVIKKQLGTLGIVPDVAENGREAYEAYISGDYDVVFLDLHMPVMDGYEAVRHIRALADPAKAQIPIIAFTASIESQQHILDCGFDDFLCKPVNMKDLREKLERIALRKKVRVG
jgi:signal transduction histidine kinase/CheY-like chemotaxis protein